MEKQLKMDNDWFLKSPIDFEHKKYVLLDFLKKIENEFTYGKIYPAFTEVVMQMASVQNFMKNHKYLYLDKQFEFDDDEVMSYEIKEKRPRKKFNQEDLDELDRICKYSSVKFMEYFAIAKSIWSFVYETTHVRLKKGTPNLTIGMGLVFYTDKFTDKKYIWTYDLKPVSEIYADYKCVFNEIYCGDKKITSKTLKKLLPPQHLEYYSILPMFEAFSAQNFDLNQTIIPIFKRKVLTFVFQSIRKMIEETNDKGN